MVEQFDIKITPFNDNRLVNVYLPKDYDETNERYPVIYMFDGHNLFYDEEAAFGSSWKLKDFMDKYSKKMIIVGVYCNMVGNGRIVEYFPYKKELEIFGNNEYIDGKGLEYLNWLCDELKPYIDKKYRTKKDRDNTMVAGSSMGGLMSLYSIVKRNDVFKYAACLSSSIYFCIDELKEEIEKSKLNKDTKIYMDYGGKENRDESYIKALHKTIEDSLVKKGVEFSFYFDENGTHQESRWGKRVPIYMKYLFEE